MQHMERGLSDHVAIMGAGAVGCYFGGMLARAGTSVTLIGRQAHTDTIARDGLHIESSHFDVRVPVRATTEPAAVSTADMVLVCVKTPDTEVAARQMQPHLRADAAVVSLQNGVDNGRRLQAILTQPVFAAVVYVGAEMAGPGHVRHTGRGELVLGPVARDGGDVRGSTARAGQIAATFETAGVPCTVSGNVEAELWAKLVLNCVYNAISALGQAQYGRMMRNDAIRALVPDIVEEVAAVARGDGFALDGDALVTACFELADAMPEQISSTAQDVLRGKRTEIDALNGYVVRRAAALGVSAPINRALHALVKLREDAPASRG
jgi:2-dehydropantoate 2-reductase